MNRPSMNPSILALSTCVPDAIYLQKEGADKAIAIFDMKEDKAALTQRIYQNSAIQKRHSVISDFNKPRAEWQFWGSDYPQQIPGMSQRNQCYKKEAPKLAEEAARNVLDRWGGDVSRISHLISVSCTGVMAPGIEFHLMQKLGLSPSTNRIGINFMGCFGAFKGLAVAKAFAQENHNHRVLLVCTELCSLHLQAEQDAETITGHSIFADGAAGAIIGQPNNDEALLWELVRTHSLGLPDSLDKMSWEAGDQGFMMRLSHTVPVLIGRQIKAFAAALLGNDVSTNGCDWAIHPGGKSIMQAVEKALALQPDQTEASWQTLRDFGNMSSATFLFVLENLSRQQKRRPWTAGLGFGPGLSAEGILLRKAFS